MQYYIIQTKRTLKILLAVCVQLELSVINYTYFGYNRISEIDISYEMLRNSI